MPAPDGPARAAVEARTRAWLEASYRTALASVADRLPTWDEAGRPVRLRRYPFQEILRKLKVFRLLDRFPFGSLLDVGSGIDVYPALVHERYGVPAYFSDFTHAMNVPFGAEASPRLDWSITLNAARLPFEDGAFDVVIASEVLEHLVRPLDVIAELRRVARVAVIMTSLEALAPSRFALARSHWRVDVREPHVERNFFLLSELEAVFGPTWHHENLLFDPDLPVSMFRSETEQDASYGALRDVDALVEALVRAAREPRHRPGAMGIVLLASRGGAALGPRRDDPALVRWLIGHTARHEASVMAVAPSVRDGTVSLPARDRPVADALLARIRCPDCRAPLERAPGSLRCTRCGATFETDSGVPILFPRRLPDEAVVDRATCEALAEGDPRRHAIIARVQRRLRRNERGPGLVRRALWRLERPLAR